MSIDLSRLGLELESTLNSRGISEQKRRTILRLFNEMAQELRRVHKSLSAGHDAQAIVYEARELVAETEKRVVQVDDWQRMKTILAEPEQARTEPMLRSCHTGEAGTGGGGVCGIA